MADNSPFSVRMEEDDKVELQKLIEQSGKSSKEFMTVLMSAYKLTKAKVEVPAIAEDIKHLEAITAQICEIYIGIGKRITTIEETKDIQYNKDLSIYKEKINKLENDIAQENIKFQELQGEFIRVSHLCDEQSKQIKGYLDTIDDKNSSIEDKDTLIREYIIKNDNLLSMLTDFKIYKDKVEESNTLLSDSKAKIMELENRIINISNEHINEISKINLTNENESNKLLAKIKLMEEQLKQQEENHRKHDESQQLRHNEELENLKEKMNFEKDRMLLDQERKFNEIINNLKSEFNSKISDIHEQYSVQTLEYQKEINNLISADRKGDNANK